MRWLLLFSLISIVLNACKKGAGDRSPRLASIYNSPADPFPAQYKYDEQGKLIAIETDYKGSADMGGGFSYTYESGKLSEVIISSISFIGGTVTHQKAVYFPDGRLKQFDENVTHNQQPASLGRYSLGYKGNDPDFDSCTIYRTVSGIEKPFLLYTFTRDGDGNILSQTSFTYDQSGWVHDKTEAFLFSTIDNPLYQLASPLDFREYHVKKIISNIRTSDHNGNLISEKKFTVTRIDPFLIKVTDDKGAGLYYDLN